MTEHNHQDISFEEFNKLIDSSDDSGCNNCFSLNHFKHLNQAARKVAWLDYTGQEEKRIELLAKELDRLKDQPVDDNIYFLIMQAELLNTNNIDHHFTIVNAVLARAKEMVKKKMPTAWVAIRSYAWIRESNLAELPQFLDKTDDLDVWQVVMQCMSSRLLSLPDLISAQAKLYQYTSKVMEMEETPKTGVVAMNGIMALMRLGDERVVELVNRLPKRKYLTTSILDQADRLIAKLTEKRSTQYLPTLMEIKKLIEQKPAP